MKVFVYLIVTSLLIQSVSRANQCATFYRMEFRVENEIKIEKHQIVINGEPQPNLYGGEFQYFRLRGGYGKNQSRESVLKIWALGLDNMVKAGMNAISFYIPWDFHEYAPGKFDFTGRADGDGDGKPDYPSRDILTFLKMAEARGIKRIMIRPGPYVNAEWGFLGFGAVPEWFHNAYPNSHMKNSKGQYTKLYDYHNEDFLRHTKLWFEALNQQVLGNVVGKGKPAVFLQLDNETNYQWQSIYNHDYGPNSIARYQTYLKNRYRSLAALNKAQGTAFSLWAQVKPPTEPDKNLTQDQDWYRFQDYSIFEYLKKVKRIWGEVGINEPNVIFTLAESFNAPKNGLLPNYRYRSNKKTGMMTINVYPKTFPTEENILYNQPHKSDYDVLAATAASQHYLGKKQETVVGPEVHTGWFGKTILTPAARQQTYLTFIGRGMKALFLYYLNEGNNWQVDWAKQKIQPSYEELHKDPRFKDIAMDKLPDIFWIELQAIVDRDLMAGWNPKQVMFEDVKELEDLHFGAPINGKGEPTEHFNVVKMIGQKIIQPYGAYLSRTTSIVDKVAIIADAGSVVPGPIPGIDSRELHSDFAAGLLGYLMQTGITPSIHHWGINNTRELAKNKVIFVQDSRTLNPKLVDWLASYVQNGGTLVSLVGDSVAEKIGAPTSINIATGSGAVRVESAAGGFDAMAASVSTYDIARVLAANPVLKLGDATVGYRYQTTGGGNLIQIGAIIHDAFNTGAYALINDIPARRKILDDVFVNANIVPNFQIAEKIPRVEVFGRKAQGDNKLWITVKTGQLEETQFHVKIKDTLLDKKAKLFKIKNVLTDQVSVVSAQALKDNGFPVVLPRDGSAAFLIEPQ